MTPIERARNTLLRIRNAALATVTPAGHPWNTPVFVAVAADLSFYWSSLRDAAHSRNIAANPAVMLALFDSTAPDDTGAGLYVTATARELSEESEIRFGLEQLAARKHEAATDPAAFAGRHPHRVYCATPETIWTNVVRDIEGQVADERVVIEAAQLFAE